MMRIILLNNHEAIVKDDKQPTVTLVNADNGTLVVEGERFAVKNGVKNPCIPDMIGIVRAYFEDARGVRWRVIKPRMVAGEPYSAVDNDYYELRLLCDAQERREERISQELLDLRAMIEPDALGFLNIGGKQNEKNEENC